MKDSQKKVSMVENFGRGTLSLHCENKHKHMRLITFNEHEQDHRLHADELDHIHIERKNDAED